MLNKHSMKIGKYEFKTCDKYLTQDGELVNAIIASNGCVICIYNQDEKEMDWSTEEVCNRMVETLDDKDFRELFKYGHEYLGKTVKPYEFTQEHLSAMVRFKNSVDKFIKDIYGCRDEETLGLAHEAMRLGDKMYSIYHNNAM